MSYRVLVVQEAEDDLTSICRYVASHESGNRANLVLGRIERALRSLERLPGRGHIPPELERIGVRRFREIHARPFRIVYEVAGDAVQIHGIFDARRDLRDLLMERLMR